MKDSAKQFIDPFSLLIVDEGGLIHRIYCPFMVKPIDLSYEREKIFGVDMIRVIPPDEILYVIEGKEYPHYLFLIL